MKDRPVVNPLLAWREIDGRVVIISPEDSIVHELNETASFMWKLIDAGCDANQVAKLLQDEYDVDLSAAEADTRQFLASLRGTGLLAGGVHPADA
ncbi:MAG: PqqD family protein [Candidatus Acidiferrales bacterium]